MVLGTEGLGTIIDRQLSKSLRSTVIIVYREMEKKAEEINRRQPLVFSTACLNHAVECFLFSSLNLVVPLLSRANYDLFITRSQTFIRLISELIERHTNGMAILEIRLMLLIMQFG